MNVWSHKSVRENKSTKQTQNPSFSSTLLDEIYRNSMDIGAQKSGEPSRKHSVNTTAIGSGRARASSAVEDEEIATLRRAFLVQKWMDMKVNARNFTHRRRASSLPGTDRKPVIDNDPFYRFDDTHMINQTHHASSITSKLRAFKIYTQIKKLNQPISPGGRLTSFLNSLFANRHLKKPKDLNDEKIERTSKSTDGSACSSASSYTRSCLSKYSPRSREKLNNGFRRTVRFYPVSVIIDEDCRPCGEKLIFSVSGNGFDDDYEDDSRSDTSSDLFELDHLSILKDCDELPVYETTNFGTNRAIANGLI